MMIKNIVIGLIETNNTSNPFEICANLDIKIIYSDLAEINGFFQRTPDEKEIIHINSELVDEEKKYVCAHELGHAILHPDVSISFFIKNPMVVKNKFENEADIFASELLLNDNDIENNNLEQMNIEQIASFLGVPQKLVQHKFISK